MSERDELADVFTGHTIGFGGFPKKLMRGHAQEIAELVLAAGYRKPRTITTAEDLDALRIEGVAIEWGGKVYGAELAVPGDRPYWFGPGRATATTVCASVDFPATVLHEPTP